MSKPLLAKGRYGTEVGPSNIGFDERPGTFHIVYERKRQPDFGALEYAYESYALPPFAPLGAGTGWVRPMVEAYPRKDQAYVAQTVLPAGMPQTAGFIYGQPMVNDQGGAAIEDLAFVVPDRMLANNAAFPGFNGL